MPGIHDEPAPTHDGAHVPPAVPLLTLAHAIEQHAELAGHGAPGPIHAAQHALSGCPQLFMQLPGAEQPCTVQHVFPLVQT
jgi:hypothetical protein